MKFQINQDDLQKLAQNPLTKVRVSDPWWLIVLKIVATLIGLFLAGYSGSAAALTVFPIITI